MCTRRNSVPFTLSTVVDIALDTLIGNSRSTKHSLGKGQTILLVITLFPYSPPTVLKSGNLFISRWFEPNYPLWKPYLLKDIELLERIRRKATKFILSDYSLDYRTRLIKISILPLMYVYEIADILFFIKSLKQPSDKFNILDHVSFTTVTTRSAGIKLYPKTASTNYIMNTYFYRLPRLWNSLPIIDLSQSVNAIKSKLKTFLWNHFLGNFDNSSL